MENQTDYIIEGIILPDANWELLTNGIINWDDIEQKMEKDEFGCVPIMICKKSSYTEAHRRAQQKYREKYPDKYNDAQRKLYDDKKKDDDWKQKFNERSRLNNKKYREKKKQELIESGVEVKNKGRPRKLVNEVVDIPIQNIVDIELKQEIVMINEPENKTEETVTEKRKYIKKEKVIENSV